MTKPKQTTTLPAERKPTKPELALAGYTIQDLCDLIETEDATYRQIAALWKITPRTLQSWIESDPERQQLAKQARQNAADFCDRQALRVLTELRPDSTQVEAMRAREIAQHLRWRARVRNPATHGDSAKIEVSLANKPAHLLTDEELLAIAAQGAHPLTIEHEPDVTEEAP